MFSNNSSFADLEPAPEEEIELTPGIEGSPWSEMINLRLVQDGHLNVLKPRGAATQVTDKLGNPVVDLSGALIQYSVSSRLPYGPRNFIVTHYDDGEVHLFCIEDKYKISFTGGTYFSASEPIKFSASEPIKVASSGQFLYLFSPATETAAYCDLSKLKADGSVSSLTLHRWLAHTSHNGAIPSNGPRTVVDENENIFGLNVGAKVIAFPHFPKNPTGTPVPINPIRLREERLDEHYEVVQQAYEVQGHYLTIGNYYEYTYKGGSFLTERQTGLDWKELNKTIIITPGADGLRDELQMIINGTGTTNPDYELLEFHNWSQRPSAPVTPFETFITRAEGAAGSHNIYVTGPDGEEHSISNADSLYKAVRATIDTDPLVDRGAKFFKDENGAVKENLDYTHPKVVRGYRFVDVLPDGSTTSPSAIVTHEIAVGDLTNEFGQIKEIDINIPIAPSHIKARYIYATRWMISKKDIFKASSKNYPNGPFFFHSEITGKYYSSFADNKGDADLTQPMSSAVPMAGGISTLVVPNNGVSGIIPKSVTALKGSLIFGGFRMKRPVPTKGVTTFRTYTTASGSGKAGTASIIFKYSNGDYSTVAEYTGLLSTQTNTLSVMAPSAIVTSIEIYFSEDAGSTYLVGEYDAKTPEFNGYGVVLSGEVLTNAEVASIPTAAEQKPDLDLDSYITSAAPAQMLTIDRSTKIVDNSLVTNIIAEKFDSNKTVLRYKVLVFTNQNIQYGYLTDADQNGMPIYRGDFEIISSQTAVTPDAVGNLGAATFFEGENGINIAEGGRITEVLDNDSILDGTGNRLINNNVTSIVYNKRYNEIFIVIGSRRVVVFSIESKSTKIFDYGTSTPIQTAVRSASKIYAVKKIGTDAALVELEDYSNQVSEIACSVTSRPIGTPRVNTRILEATLYGEGFGTILKIDLQSGRKEGQTGWNKVFNESDVNLPKRDLQMYGVSYGVGYAGHMPRIKLDMTGTTQAFLSDVILRTVQTPNTGKARK